MYKYIDKATIKKAINYFGKIKYNSPEQLGLLFFFKGIGFNNIDEKEYNKVSMMTNEDKELYNTVLYRLSALFDINENGKKRTCLFPFSLNNEGVKKGDYYNGGTPFHNLLSRIRDTMDNTLIDKGKYLDNEGESLYKLSRKYLTIVKDSFFTDSEISLTFFAVWYMRFREFEDVEGIDNEMLKNVCIQKTCEELNITDDEKKYFFLEDTEEINFTSDKISGEDFRAMIKFIDEPEIEDISDRSFEMNTNDTIKKEYIFKVNDSNGDNISVDDLYKLVIKSKQVILHGAPGTGKSYITDELRKKFDETMKIQFHPSMSYEQFIGGFTVNKEGSIVPKIGKFLEFCLKAKTENKKFLFIIDEINRGNISSIFGETILALDRGYVVELIQNLKDAGDNEITEFSIPENVYIIGTMNSADRSIALIDYAIRRRFAFVKFLPNSDVVKNNITYTGANNISIEKLMNNLNKRIMTELKDEDLLLGQSYFLPKWIINGGKYIWDDYSIQILFNNYLIPILEEYTYGNTRQLNSIIGDNLVNRIKDNAEFIAKLKEEFDV